MAEPVGNDDNINENDLILLHGFLCCNTSLLLKDCIGCSGEREFLCCVDAWCCKQGVSPYGPACVMGGGDERLGPKNICMLQCFCCQTGYKMPETCCLEQAHCCCFVSNGAYPPTDEIPLTCAIWGLQCLPGCGCCKTLGALRGDSQIGGQAAGV